MKEIKEIRDDQIRIIGEKERKTPLRRNVWIIILSIIVVVIVGVIVLFESPQKEEAVQELMAPEPALFEPEPEVEPIQQEAIGQQPDSLVPGYTEIRDTVLNDIPIKIFIPHNAEMSLHIGEINKEDKNVIYVAQAADIRADNGEIVGAFVLKGEPKAWGLSKKGFCASIGGEITIGVAENSPLFEKATEEGGYFFRQYPLVSNGQIVENKPKGKSIRRAICDRQGEIFMVETRTIESFHDFAQVLVDLGVDQAVYLVGSLAYRLAVDEVGAVHEFGDKNHFTELRSKSKNTSYIVWRKK